MKRVVSADLAAASTFAPPPFFPSVSSKSMISGAAHRHHGPPNESGRTKIFLPITCNRGRSPPVEISLVMEAQASGDHCAIRRDTHENRNKHFLTRMTQHVSVLSLSLCQFSNMHLTS
jgi:hypothetical protein